MLFLPPHPADEPGSQSHPEHGWHLFTPSTTVIALIGNSSSRLHALDAGHLRRLLFVQLAGGSADVPGTVTTPACTSCGMQPNAVLTITGTDLPNEFVILGAHADTTIGSATTAASRAPGSDDDASGVATLTEVLRVAVANGYRPRRTVQFIAYAAEEVGLRGSRSIAQRSCSDHASWTQAGFPAAAYLEGSFRQTNQNIHTSRDTLATAGGSARHSVNFARLGLAFVAEVGKGGR